MMTNDDDTCLQILAGANFGPNSRLILPSGEVIDADEAQALTAAYAPTPRKGSPMTVESEQRFLLWVRFAESGRCEYCGERTHVQLEPFGRRPACFTCWEQVCYGEEGQSDG